MYKILDNPFQQFRKSRLSSSFPSAFSMDLDPFSDSFLPPQPPSSFCSRQMFRVLSFFSSSFAPSLSRSLLTKKGTRGAGKLVSSRFISLIIMSWLVGFLALRIVVLMCFSDSYLFNRFFHQQMSTSETTSNDTASSGLSSRDKQVLVRFGQVLIASSVISGFCIFLVKWETKRFFQHMNQTMNTIGYSNSSNTKTSCYSGMFMNILVFFSSCLFCLLALLAHILVVGHFVELYVQVLGADRLTCYVSIFLVETCGYFLCDTLQAATPVWYLSEHIQIHHQLDQSSPERKTKQEEWELEERSGILRHCVICHKRFSKGQVKLRCWTSIETERVLEKKLTENHSIGLFDMHLLCYLWEVDNLKGIAEQLNYRYVRTQLAYTTPSYNTDAALSPPILNREDPLTRIELEENSNGLFHLYHAGAEQEGIDLEKAVNVGEQIWDNSFMWTFTGILVLLGRLLTISKE